MKKLIFLCLILISCEKDDTYCWRCRKDIYLPTGQYQVVVQVCDMTEYEAHDFEHANSSIKGIQTVKMTCTKENEK